MEKNKCTQKESGQALVTVTIALLVLLLFGALAIDVGQMYMRRRHMQNAADAGALAGARVLCTGGTSAQAVAAASDYAGARNSAPQVVAAVEGNIVVVTTTIPVTSNLAQLIGIITTDVHAVAKAACGSATAGCGVFPIAFDITRYNNISKIPCNGYFYVWADKNDDIGDDLCLNCDCGASFLGRDVLAPGHRGWLQLSPPDSPYPSTCKDNCGGILKCWVLNDWPGQVAIDQCIPGEPGTDASSLANVDERINDVVSIVLFDPAQPAGVCTSENTIGTCPGTPYQVKGFGCVKIIDYISKLTMNPLPDAPNPKYKCPKNDKVILVQKMCGSDCPFSSCGSTDGGSPALGGISAVSLVD